jgi:hypothetical protein
MREEPVAGQVEQEVEVVADDDDAFQVRAARFDPELDALAGAIRRRVAGTTKATGRVKSRPSST